MKLAFTAFRRHIVRTVFISCVASMAVWETAQCQVTPIFTNSHPRPSSSLLELQGTYYNDIALGTAVFTRHDSTINFNWGLGSPDPRINADNFSIHWTGLVVPPYSGTYTFYSVSDDGFRLWVNGQLIIDSWVDQAATEHVSTPINLSADTLYDITAEFYEHSGDAVAQLFWSGPNVPKEIVGSSYYPNGAGDAFGMALASLGGGRYAVGAPLLDILSLGILYTDMGRLWFGDSTGGLQFSPSSPSAFLLIGPKPTYFAAAMATLPDGRLLTGRPGHSFRSFRNSNHFNVGAVYLISSPGETNEASVGVGNPGSGADNTYFGYAVAALTGNRFAASLGEGPGEVFLFDASQASPVVLAGVTNPNPASVANPTPPYPSQGFGAALAGLGSGRLLIGAPVDSNTGDNAGSVYIYDFSGTLVGSKIHNPTGKHDLFGSALVAVDEHRFLVGAPSAAVTYLSSGSPTGFATNQSAGAVYLYDDTGTRLLTVTAPDISVSGNFGATISLLGPDRVLIGSPSEKVGATSGAGRVHLFNLAGVHLETLDKTTAHLTPAPGDQFGAAIAALDERRFVIGAPGDDTFQTDAGSVYGFDAPAPTAELGAIIPKPNGVEGSAIFQSQGPAINPAGAAFWHVTSQQLFAVKTGGILVSWPLSTGQTNNWQGTVGWPTNNARYQLHVAGQTPVDLSGGGAFSNVVLEETTTDAEPATVNSTRVFSAQNPGYSLLMLSAGDPASNAIRFQLVRSIAWNDPAYLFDNAPATIGEPITDPGGFHDAAAGSPQVVLPNGVYCPAPVFDPATRTGTIIPVNKNHPSNPTGDLVVAFYQRGTVLYDPTTGLAVNNNIFWPYKPVRFQPQWPSNSSNTIVIASQTGTGVIDPVKFVNWQLYYQNDVSQAGFNPNDEHALRLPYGGGEAVFALRSDLGTPQTSDPYVLIRYQDPASGGQWRMKVWQVVAEQAPSFFRYQAQAGSLLQSPFPVSALAPAPQTAGVSGPYWRDRKLFFWAMAAGNDGGNADIVMHYFYPMQSGFFYPGANPPPVGANVPLLDLAAGTPGTPIDVHFDTSWPAMVPELRVGETLVKPKFGLPDISSQTSVEIIYDQATALKQGASVKLIDPTREYHVTLAQLPADIQTSPQNGMLYFPVLPPQLQARFFYDPSSHWLRFKGQFIVPPAGEYYLLLNVLTARDIAALSSLSTDPLFAAAVNALAALTASVTEVPPDATGFDSLALTAGLAQGQGYATLAFGNNPNLSPPAEPVSLAIIRVSCPTYQGELKVIESENPFDEKLTLRHSGDFAGKTDGFVFEWRTLPPVGGLPSTAPPDQWTLFSPNPATGLGAADITIAGPGLFTLSDNYFIARYRPVSSPLCAGPTNTAGWSDWTQPMLAEGWIKRVLAGINPFEQRIQSYQNSTVNTVVNMLSQAGPPFQGPVALNQQNADQFGLIETYETVLRRGKGLSIDAPQGVNYGPANDALLLAAGRLADLYMLLGNEAFADAADPTIAFGTDDKVYGAEATSLHCFMNQTASLMEEELDLLRGRDNSLLPAVTTYPFYNRLIWNFTRGIDGGEVAYALNYNIRAADGNVSGVISEADARALYPQGHGDAWGHYLSAIKNYYRLLRNPNFTWVPRVEAVLVGGVPVSVDYFDERKFAAAAAARAQTGAEIVSLTYRNAYVEDPAGQWQGYQDSSTNRAWGLAEWGSRAGQGAFFDWVAGNALLPDVDPDSTHAGIRKIDRTTVTGLRDIASALQDIQTKVDQADSGLNPLGLAKNVVPFDIDPTQIAAGKTHFEQIYDRAVVALNNAITVFNRANNSTQLLRRQADTVSDFQKTVTDKEADFNSRLIEIFGYPYPDDIGPTGAYPTGYSGPDIYHYDYVDSSQLIGQTPPPTQTLVASLIDFGTVAADGALSPHTNNVQFTLSSEDLGLVKPASWTASRRAPGQIQMARSDLLQAYARFLKALEDYKSLTAQIEDSAALLQQQFNVNSNELFILNNTLGEQKDLNREIVEAHTAAYVFDALAKNILNVATATAESLPKVVGLATDATAPARGAINLTAAFTAKGLGVLSDLAQGKELLDQQDKEIASLQSQISVTSIKNDQAFAAQESQLEILIRQEASSRLELFTMQEALQQVVGRYSAALAAGERLLEDRLRFRQETAAQIQDYRYKDMAFRIFRNDTLQKYRAQFDLAAMYVYLAARAYDYETNLRKDDPRGAGTAFMTGIIRSRALGLVTSGLPQTGSGSGDPGLADPMARMSLDWQLVLKGQLGFNNPQTETGRFSLRSELFRIQAGLAGGKVWRDTLTRNVVPNVLDVPEFKRYCILFKPSLPVEPAIVIPFSTSINFGQNFFGWPAGGGDNDYDSTHFVTKIRSVGVWFANYNNLNLINTPRVYLIPVGEDVMRSPSLNVGDIRQWKILDQKLPVPFPLSGTDLANPTWIPLNDSLIGQLGDIRQYAEFRAYHDSGSFDPSQTISDTRLIGRSVWNTRWLLIIPAGNLLSDRNEAIQRFINGSLKLDGTRDGNGITDIKIFFQTYAFSGN